MKRNILRFWGMCIGKVDGEVEAAEPSTIALKLGGANPDRRRTSYVGPFGPFATLSD